MAYHSKLGRQSIMHILIVRNNSNPQAIDASIMLSAYFSSQDIGCTLVNATDLGPGDIGVETVRRALLDGVDMAVVLGETAPYFALRAV